MEVRFKRMSEHAKMPTYATEGSCGADLYAAEEIDIAPGRAAVIRTDIAVEIPAGHVGLVMTRSGMASRQTPAECGVIDEDYRGGIGVTISNQKPFPWLLITTGARVAQLLIVPCVRAKFVEADELSETERGSNGWGSTGR